MKFNRVTGDRLIVAACLLLLTGCAKPQLQTANGMVIATGTVTLDGNPLDPAQIKFVIPDAAGKGAAESYVAAISKGKFEIEVPPGDFRVEIRQLIETSNSAAGGGPVKQVLPKQWNEASTLTATITQSGPNDIKFDLKTP
ncbi:hypothetical protein [Planctomicrobium sp. SH664]|uniref:hypothetical protein n=1 Tax=Planctomicrobium sp. SH664 TaxID=3448125 RepID=UPI003F5B8AA5